MNIVTIFGLVVVATALINLFITKFDPYRLNILTLIVGAVLVFFGGIGIDHIELLLVLLGSVIAILSFFMYWKITSAPWTFGFDWTLIFVWLEYLFNQFVIPICLIGYGIYLLLY